MSEQGASDPPVWASYLPGMTPSTCDPVRWAPVDIWHDRRLRQRRLEDLGQRRGEDLWRYNGLLWNDGGLQDLGIWRDRPSLGWARRRPHAQTGSNRTGSDGLYRPVSDYKYAVDVALTLVTKRRGPRTRLQIPLHEKKGEEQGLCRRRRTGWRPATSPSCHRLLPVAPPLPPPPPSKDHRVRSRVSRCVCVPYPIR